MSQYNLRQRSGAEGNLQTQENPFLNLNFSSNIQQQSITPYLQPSQLELLLKAEIQKHFPGVEIFMESDIVSRFGSYMTGIGICVVYNNKIIAIYLKQTDTKTTIKDLSHFVFCSNRLANINPHFRLYMLTGSKLQPSKNFIDLMNDHKVYAVVSNDQQTLINQLTQTIYEMLIDTSIPMEIC